MEHIIKVCAIVEISLLDKVRIGVGLSADLLKNRIKRELILKLSEEILENKEKMPITIQQTTLTNSGADEYKMSMNLISDERLKELLEMEQKYIVEFGNEFRDYKNTFRR